MAHRTTEAPKLIEDGDFGKRYEHPAYGAIDISRCQGSVPLFNVDHKVHNHIRLTIAPAEYVRNLHHDRVHPKQRELIEVWMSEAQWATAITSMNTSGNTPVTIAHVNMQPMPYIEQMPKGDMFKTELDDTVKETVQMLHSVLKELEETKGAVQSGRRQVLKAAVAKAVQNLECNLDFISDSFGKQMQKVVEEAKQEINGFATDRLQQAGLESYATQLQIEKE